MPSEWHKPKFVELESTSDPRPDARPTRWSAPLLLILVLLGPLAHVLIVALIVVALLPDGKDGGGLSTTATDEATASNPVCRGANPAGEAIPAPGPTTSTAATSTPSPAMAA